MCMCAQAPNLSIQDVSLLAKVVQVVSLLQKAYSVTLNLTPDLLISQCLLLGSLTPVVLGLW